VGLLLKVELVNVPCVPEVGVVLHDDHPRGLTMGQELLADAESAST
jgi:hypothetical protein